MLDATIMPKKKKKVWIYEINDYKFKKIC